MKAPEKSENAAGWCGDLNAVLYLAGEPGTAFDCHSCLIFRELRGLQPVQPGLQGGLSWGGGRGAFMGGGRERGAGGEGVGLREGGPFEL